MKSNFKKIIKSKYFIFIILLLISIFSVSYAVMTFQFRGEKNYTLTIGTLDFSIDSEQNAIRLMNAYPMTDTEGKALRPYTFSITNTGNVNEYYKVSLITDTEQQASCTGCTFLEPSKLRYSVTIDGEVGATSTVSDEVLLDLGELTPNQTKNYELRLWLNQDATIEEENKYYFGRIKVEASQKEYAIASRKFFDSKSLGSNCKTYDDGTDTFLVGQCSNNYVWYSGKLWRVVLKNNETGAVKMVTDNAITAIPYNASGNSAFKDSYMDQWLTQEFLPTLHDYEDYLVVDSIWDATANTSSTPSRPTYETQVTRAVGLLNFYEYYTTYNNSDGLATYQTGYLNNGVSWWLMTPRNVSGVRYVYNDGSLSFSAYPTLGHSARPSVNLKSTIQITGGTGIQADPYILEEDIQEPENGTTLLSTRYSGEYITFNNELYRIVNTENGLAKITAVDKPSILSSNTFDSNASIDITNFANASIKTDLETYYQNLKTTNEDAYNMIEPSTTWYLGQVGDGVNYKASICASIDSNTSMNACEEKAASTTASIGLPRVGEMFTSQITRGTKTTFWTLNPYNSLSLRTVDANDSLKYTYHASVIGARPSMYLKSGVKIATTNTGNGTYEHPYSIE